MFGAPQARFRIYTRPDSYTEMAKTFLAGSASNEAPIQDLEQEVARRVGVPYALAMPTARTGIYVTLLSLIRPGQKVLLSPLTIVDVINMVLCAGGVPTFVDIEKNTCNINAEALERLIDRDTGAVLVTHLHGLACDIQRIRDLCEKNGVPLVEDAAQSYSAKVDGRWTGTFGRAGIFSFGLYKIVNAFYGGMVVTRDEKLYLDLKQRVSAWPRMKKSMLLHKVLFGLATDLSTLPLPFSLFTYWFFRYGYLHGVEAIQNMVTVDRHPTRRQKISEDLLCRMWPSQARLIRRQLDAVTEKNDARVRAAEMYDTGLKDISELILPPLRNDSSHIYTYYPIRCPDRHAFMRYAFHKRRDLVLSHYHNTASLDIFQEYYRDCPVAQATAQQLVYLPSYPRYEKEQIKQNIQVIREFYKRGVTNGRPPS